MVEKDIKNRIIISTYSEKSAIKLQVKTPLGNLSCIGYIDFVEFNNDVITSLGIISDNTATLDFPPCQKPEQTY